ncbi:MAG TPA: DHA2 family efflux MFS transporter permease subunit [Deinococcales bacterium]|nr:DHA2 family efflux MFS transporter permease subunit [Deinococcales bacterium]
MTAAAHVQPGEYTPQQRFITMAGLMAVFMLGALDQTVVSTAMPRIVQELNGLDLYAWVSTAYLLSSTVMVPIYGKLSDLYGRKVILSVGVVIFLLGSALCGLAGEFGSLPVIGNAMDQLVVFRGLQGLGGAALFSSAFAVIADMYPPSERGRFSGLFGGVFGLAAVIGPSLGGFLTDNATTTILGHVVAGWRWVFYVNLPVGAVALFMILARMPTFAHKGQARVDYLGAFLVIAAFVPLLLALTWGGSTYPWGDARIVGLFAGSAVALVAFVLAEMRNPEPILSLHLFRNKVFSTANLAAFIIGAAFFGVILFLPLFMQQVMGISATNSGVIILPLMAGLIFSSVLSGQIVSRFRRYKVTMIVGNVILLVGLYLLTRIGVTTSRLDLDWRMVIVGLGLGPAQSLFALAVQNAVDPQDLGVATSASQFFRQVGSTIGAALFGTFLTNSLAAELPRHLPASMAASAQHLDLNAMRAGGGGSAGQKIQASFDARYNLWARGVNGDPAAGAQLLADPKTPATVKALVKAGGVPNRVHQMLERRYAPIKAAIASGSKPALDAAASEASLPANLSDALARVTPAALASPATQAQLQASVEQAIQSQTPRVAAQSAKMFLDPMRAALNQQAARLTAQVNDGVKQALSDSIVKMFSYSVFMVLAGLVVIAFIPEVILRNTTGRRVPVE